MTKKSELLATVAPARTRSEKVVDDITAMIKTRTPILWVVTTEEARAERYLAVAADTAKYGFRTWDVATGIALDNGEADQEAVETEDIVAAINYVRACSESRLWVMRDAAVWLSGGLPVARTVRFLRNAARTLPFADAPQTIVVLSPSPVVPDELRNHTTVIDWPLPDRVEIGEALDAVMEPYAGDDRVEKLNGNREAAIDAAVGLTEEEALACFNVSLVKEKRINPVLVANEKRRVIARERILEWYEPVQGGLATVGGLENIKRRLLSCAVAYTADARAYGLVIPKGLLIVGIPGTGKSLTPKALSSEWGCPLIRMDLGALKGKFVGESEANIRRAQKVIEALGRCIVWLDEIEKMFQGATSGSSDGGTSADQLGTMLSWMQERAGEAFIVATANDVTALPPELLRKGRFDDVFWVDLPNDDERLAILKAALKANKRNVRGAHDLALAKVAVQACENFTGAEIAAIVPDAMLLAYTDGKREITPDDLTAAAAEVVPLAKTAATKIASMREWAKGKARPASAAPTTTTVRKVRALDIQS
jgi:ATP-dependent 26S proteasome regulatory subunit